MVFVAVYSAHIHHHHKFGLEDMCIVHHHKFVLEGMAVAVEEYIHHCHKYIQADKLGVAGNMAHQNKGNCNNQT